MLRHRGPLVLALALAALAACAPDSTQPSGLIRTGEPMLGLFDPEIEVDVLQRTTPLLHNFAAVGLIGRTGGTISLRDAGFSITFPPNAVTLPTLVTVAAVPGTGVAYVLEPHGLRFREPPVITLDLRGTEVFQDPSGRAELEGAYVPGAALLDGLVARVSETRPTTVDVTGWKMRFTIDHFSTYVAASGRRSGYISSSGNLIPSGN
jgi:hypothetical protein